MKKLSTLWLCLIVSMAVHAELTDTYPMIQDKPHEDFFPLSEAVICTDDDDEQVVLIAAEMLANDIERVTGICPQQCTTKTLPKAIALVAGTLGHSRLIEQLVRKQKIDVAGIKGKWESFIMMTTEHPQYHTPLLAIIGSDRRGTAYGLTSLSEAIGVSPWYWWADVMPAHKTALYVEPGIYCQEEPSVQYRGIFINDERFGGWARWAEQRHGKVGPETYQKVFELLLRLRANYLWPAMHPGTQAFNADPENARLADDYAIVMGSSHCEQMLRNNEGEWKAVNERALRQAGLNAAEREQSGQKARAVNERALRQAGLNAAEREQSGLKAYGDFNYITNRKTIQQYWEERVRPMVNTRISIPLVCEVFTTILWRVPTRPPSVSN